MKKGRPRKLSEECVKRDLEQYGLRERMRTIERNGESKLKQKIANPATQDNSNSVVVVAVV